MSLACNEVSCPQVNIHKSAAVVSQEAGGGGGVEGRGDPEGGGAGAPGAVGLGKGNLAPADQRSPASSLCCIHALLI